MTPMPPTTPTTTHEGFRHLYTVAPSADGGNPAFRTVALSDSLEPVRAELEEIVGAFTSPADRRDSRQAVQMYDEGYVALTTTTPLDGGPDGRRGNYLAETFVVPTAWLGDSGDDLAAAFAALSWSDPGEIDLGAGGVRSLGAGQALPRLVPGPLSRLEVLRERVPETILAPLLAAVARAALGRRPLLVVEGSASGVDRLLPLLHLVLPPTARRVRDDEGHRPVQIRTWSPPGESPTVDLVGVPADARGAAERAGGVVIDLSAPGATIADAGDDPAGRFGRWAAGVVAAGDWQALADSHERAGDASIEAFLDGFEAPAELAGSSSLLDARRADWLSREALDQLFVERSQRLAAEHEKTTQQLEQQVDAVFDDLQRQLDERIRTRTSELRRVADEETERLEGETAKASEELRKIAGAERKKLRERASDLGKDLVRDGKRARKLAAGGGGELDDGPEPPARYSGSGRLSGGRGGFPSWIYAVGAIVLAVALAAVWWMTRQETATADGPVDPVDTVAGDDSIDLEPVLTRLGATAGRLLAAAADDTVDPATRDLAARLYLDLLLDETGAASGEVRDALVQSIVGAGVDGQPGSGTQRAVATYLEGAATCCSDLSVEARRSCVLLDAVGLSGPACAGTDPFGGTVPWTPEPAGELLTRVRTARQSAAAGIAPGLAALDLLTAPAPATALASATVDDDEAQRLLSLARALATETAPSALPREISAAELEAVETLEALAGGTP